METRKLFNQVIGEFPAVSQVRLWNDYDKNYKLIGWNSSHIYICSLTKMQVLNVMISPKFTACYEELISPENIIEVFCFENNFYTIDSKCNLSEIVREDHHDMDWEGDLFEETPKKVIKSQLKRRLCVYKESTLLAACVVSNDVAFLLNTSNSIKVKIVNIKTLQQVHCFDIRNSPLTVSPQHNMCLMLFVPKENIEDAFIRNWFPEIHLERFDSGLLIISLPECVVCGVLLDAVPCTPHFIFSWPFQALDAKWFCRENKEPDRIQRKCNLLIVFDGGAMVNLQQYGGSTIYFPLNRIHNACITSQYVLVTDNSNCYYMKTFDNEEITCLPLKGVISFSPIVEQNDLFFATTKHKTLYAVDLSVKIEKERFTMPEENIWNEFLRKNKYLDQLCQQIKEKDNYINALSYALSASVMEFGFSVQVVLIAGALHTFRIKINSENAGITFSKTVWSLGLSLYTNDCCFTFIRNLERDLTLDNPFVDFITVECKGNYWDFVVNAKLVCYTSKDKYRPTVDVGTVSLNISHFIQPISSIKIHQSHLEKDEGENALLKYLNKNEATSNTFSKDVCSFKIPIDECLSNMDIVRKLLNNCRALWRASEWAEICNKDKFQIFIAGNVIDIEISTGYIIVKGKHVQSCHLLKVAVVELLNTNFKLNISENMVQKVEDLLKSLEILQYCTEDDPTLHCKTISLYKEFKDSILLPLTGIKFNFNCEIINTNKLLEDCK